MAPVDAEAGEVPTELREERRRKRRKSRLLVWLEYGLFRLVALAFRRAGPRQLDRWSRRTAAVASRLLRSRHRLALRNLARVFPELPASRREQILRECWRHYARSIFEYLHTIDWPPERIAARYAFDGPVDEFFASIRTGPTIIVTAHFGNWEMAASILARFDREIAAVARRLDNPRIDEHLLRGRMRAGMTILDRRRAARDLVRTLERGGTVAVVADQAVKPREGLLVPFLGSPAWTTTGPARLALRFDAPIWCVASVPREDGYLLHVEPPIRPSALPPERRTLEGVTREINDRISRRILASPELWLWMHDRWKGAPMDFPEGPPV